MRDSSFSVNGLSSSRVLVGVTALAAIEDEVVDFLRLPVLCTAAMSSLCAEGGM